RWLVEFRVVHRDIEPDLVEFECPGKAGPRAADGERYSDAVHFTVVFIESLHRSLPLWAFNHQIRAEEQAAPGIEIPYLRLSREGCCFNSIRFALAEARRPQHLHLRVAFLQFEFLVEFRLEFDPVQFFAAQLLQRGSRRLTPADRAVET